jgi:hypothetical protein
MPRDAPWIKETCLGDDEGGESPGDAADADVEACASLRLERTAVGALAREDVPTDDVETPPRQTGIRRAADRGGVRARGQAEHRAREHRTTI